MTSVENRLLITAITVTRNASDLIERTVRSITTQSVFSAGTAELQYILHDGASSDDTIAVALAAAGTTNLTVRSMPDSGMYDALAAALDVAEGRIIFYLNAGDVLFPGALDVVVNVMKQTHARWVTGYDAIVNAAGAAVSVRTPFRYRPALMRAGEYGRRLPFLQQESTFWTSDMMSTVDLDVLRSFRLAGDHYLWRCFSSLEEVTVVRALLGGFTMHANHLSSDLDSYRREVPRAALALRPPGLLAIDRLLWLAPDRVKKKANRRHFLMFDQAKGLWR